MLRFLCSRSADVTGLLCRLFNETPVNPRKCTAVLAKILYLLNQGETLGTTEATECFFAITKLFQVTQTDILTETLFLASP